MTPTLELFLKSPRPGSVKTRLAPDIGAREAAALYRAMAEHAVRAAEETGWTVTVWYAPAEAGDEMRAWLGDRRRLRPQQDGDLGARLAHAVTGCQPGAARILIGGDCPGLDATVLAEAADALTCSPVVIGPSDDGGYYLLGARCPCPDLFSGMPWSTPRLLECTRRRLEALGVPWVELPTLRDVDTLADAVALGLIS